MKVGKKNNKEYPLKLMVKIWRFGFFFSLKSGEFGPFSPMNNPFILIKILFFRSKFGENLPVQEMLLL
jgi:hypothetical protein